MLSYLKYFLYSMTSIIYPVFYDIYNMKLSVVIYPYPTSLPLANAAPIGSQSPGTNLILKLFQNIVIFYHIFDIFYVL